ncbi:hypothetical protein [Roseibium sp. SCP14]|uniref:hypothetical protein n=1 Tax=Roseibium sp. SCP14 TaxID=3141375 RepID=UPI00333E141A
MLTKSEALFVAFITALLIHAGSIAYSAYQDGQLVDAMDSATAEMTASRKFSAMCQKPPIR